jgi:hypothetical protein
MDRPEVTGEKRDTIAKRHDWLWHRCVEGASERPKANLLVFEGESDSGYRSEHNEIHIVLAGWDLDEVPSSSDAPAAPSAASWEGWPIWEQHLHHEFVHEYQDKVVRGRTTEEGLALYSDPAIRRFVGPGHDATYYTAAVQIAKTLGFDVRQFVNSL